VQQVFFFNQGLITAKNGELSRREPKKQDVTGKGTRKLKRGVCCMQKTKEFQTEQKCF
jgi:hypothetical protein